MNIDYEKKIDSNIRFWARCFCNFLFFGAGIVFCIIILTPFWINTIQDYIIFDVQKLTIEEHRFLDLMIESNKLHTSEFVVERLVHFYESMITILISISAIGGLLGYLYIKNSHRRDIEEALQAFMASITGKSIIKEHSKEPLKELFNQFKNEGDIREWIEKAEQSSVTIDEILKRQSIIEDQMEHLLKTGEIKSETLVVSNPSNQGGENSGTY